MTATYSVVVSGGYMRKLSILKCLHCRYIWPSRLGRKPRVCPNCKSYNWDKLPKIKHRRVSKKYGYSEKT